MKTSARLFLSCTALLLSAHLEAQTFTHISSSEGNTWQQAKSTNAILAPTDTLFDVEVTLRLDE